MDQLLHEIVQESERRRREKRGRNRVEIANDFRKLYGIMRNARTDEDHILYHEELGQVFLEQDAQRERDREINNKTRR